MPELPEVETIVRGLAKRVIGAAIESVWLSGKAPLKSAAAEIVATLEGARILNVRRMGKHIVLDLQRPGRRSPEFQKKSAKRDVETTLRSSRSGSTSEISAQWIVHLGMTGRLQVCEPDAEIVKHTHAIAKLASGKELRFVDPRRFGRLSVAKKGDFEAGGVEPLEVELDKFTELFHGRKVAIKSALLNQKLLRGVGNIYADESLFRAGIRPRRRAATISHEKLRRLFLAVREVLTEAIDSGGSSISDYVDADGEEGFFQLRHRVYGREGEPCLVCQNPVKRVVIGGRSSHYCAKCQR